MARGLSFAVILIALVVAFDEVAAQCSQGSCASFNINNCLGTISSSGFTQTGFSTSGLNSQLKLDCDSGDSGLRDRMFQFAVATSGLYTVKTHSIGSFDTVMEVLACSNSQVLGCSDDIDFDAGNLASSLTLPLSSGKQFTAAVSKYQSGDSDPTFGLAITPVCLCSAFAPDACFGTVPSNSLVVTGLTTRNKADRAAFTCGSKATGLNDFVFTFQVSTTGLYSIITENISSDTTLQLFTCSGSVVACNDDIILNQIYSSEIKTTLTAGTSYVAMVSKYDSGTSEQDFDIAIRLVTGAPTLTPATVAPTLAAQTPAPTAATNVPTTNVPTTTKQPTFAPSVSPTLRSATANPTNSPTIATTNEGTNATLPEDSTASPTSLGEAAASDLNVVAIGGGVGAGTLLLALGLVARRRSRIRRQSLLERESWSPVEQERLRSLYMSTHDFEYICSVFPNKSRESVALRIKEVLDGRGSAQTIVVRGDSLSPEEGYTFAKNALPTSSLKKETEMENIPPPPPITQPLMQHASRIKSAVKESVSKFSSRMASTSNAASEYIASKLTKSPVMPPPGISSFNPLYAVPPSPSVSASKSPDPSTLRQANNWQRSSIDPSAIPPPPPPPMARNIDV